MVAAAARAAFCSLGSQKDAEVWLDAERANLHAAARHAAAGGLAVHAVWIPAQLAGFLATHGYWDQALTLHQTAAGIAQSAGDRAGQATALHNLGYAHMLISQYPAAIRALTAALGLCRDLGDEIAQVDMLTLLGAASLTEALTLARDIGDRQGQAYALNHLGAVQADPPGPHGRPHLPHRSAQHCA